MIYDDDHYYMGGVLAELLRAARAMPVTFVTPAAEVATWTRNTLEQEQIQTRLLELGVDIRSHRALTRVSRGGVEIACVYTGEPSDDSLRRGAAGDGPRPARRSLPRVCRRGTPTGPRPASPRSRLIGDAYAPGLIAAAVYAGHRYAQELDAPDIGDALPFKRDLAELAPL